METPCTIVPSYRRMHVGILIEILNGGEILVN